MKFDVEQLKPHNPSITFRAFMASNFSFQDDPSWNVMVFADDIRKTILRIAEERGAGNAFSPKDVACRVDKKNAHELLEVVYFVASVLIKEGKISLIRAQEKSADQPLYIKST